MRPDKQSTSFTFHRNIFSTSSGGSSNPSGTKMYNCRKKLQDRFNEEKTKPEDDQEGDKQVDRSVLSVLSLNDTRKMIREGAEKISKTFSNVRTTLGTFSQKFKMPTKRRQILEEGPMTPNVATPHTMSRSVLGRTPTKMYSPFSIDSPYHATTISMSEKENMAPNNIKIVRNHQ